MQRKRVASVPCIKAESGSQTTHNKRVAKLSATTPVVQIPTWVWNTAECKCTLEVLPAGVSTKRATEQHRHLNRNKTQTNRRNTLRNFHCTVLAGTSTGSDAAEKSSICTLHQGRIRQPNHSQQTRCKTFGNNARGSDPNMGLEHRRMQMHSGGASCRGIHQTRNRTAQASEPEQNSKNQPQFIEKLFIAWFWQTSPLVQIRRKIEASEPYSKAESGSQPTHNKRVAKLSATTPVVQIPTHMNR